MGGPPQGSFPGSGEVQPHKLQPGKYEIFPGREEAQPGSYGEVQAEIEAGLLGKPTRGIAPSTLLRLWEGLHSFPGSGEVQQHKLQPGKYEIFPGREDAQPGSYGEVQAEIEAGLLGKPTRGIAPSTLLRLWEGLHSFPGSGEVQQHKLQPGKYEIFPGREEAQPGSYGEVQAEIEAGLLGKPTRGIAPSTLLRLWEGLHSFPGSGEVQQHKLQPGKYLAGSWASFVLRELVKESARRRSGKSLTIVSALRVPGRRTSCLRFLSNV